MESKWPFMLIAFCFVFLLGLVISGLERNNVIKNWDKRRCDLAVMAAASFFKEESDPRSRTEFAKDNFNFCMGTFVDKFITLLMTPVAAMFEKQVNLTDSSMGMLNSIRSIAQTLYNTLSSYLEQFYRRFNASIFEISRIAQYLRMAMQRVNGMALSMVYTGITMFRGMLNAIQFVIRVILIICAIMIALIIVLCLYCSLLFHLLYRHLVQLWQRLSHYPWLYPVNLQIKQMIVRRDFVLQNILLSP